MRKYTITTVLAFVLMVSACQTPSAITPTEEAAPVEVDLRVRAEAAAPYIAKDAFNVPADHTIGDGMFPYEGIGWENGFVGYRLYLDKRLVSDVFGKRTRLPALKRLDRNSKYHALGPWGMDVLHVGPSLGIGGLGIVGDGVPRQFGGMERLSVKIETSGGEEGAFTVTAQGVRGPKNTEGDVVSSYRLTRLSPMTRVDVQATGNLPLATGLVSSDKARFWQSGDEGQWRYIATYGNQSENKDNLGLALFYRADQARYGGVANETHFITFSGNVANYGFLAAWELDSIGVKDRAGFAAFIDEELMRLEKEAGI